VKSSANSTKEPTKDDSNKEEVVEATIDTTSQVWKDQHYYRGTTIPLPDSLKDTPGLGTRTWYSQKKYEYKPIVFDNAGDPNIEVTKIHFMDSITKAPTSSLIIYEKNPYKDLPYKRISGNRLMKVDGIIRYDLNDKSKNEIKSFLLSMGVNIDTVPSKIAGIEVMTGENSPEEKTALAISYAIQVLDVNGKIIANQTSYNIYDRYGNKTSEIIENGHGLYQFAITRDGQHLAAVFGGRYGCRSGQYLKPYFKIFKTKDGEVIHQEDMEFSDGVAAHYNYFTVWDGGSIGNMNCRLFNIEFEKIYDLNFKDIPRKNSWNERTVITKLDKYDFTDTKLKSSSFKVN
jgi:hypothetical protein